MRGTTDIHRARRSQTWRLTAAITLIATVLASLGLAGAWAIAARHSGRQLEALVEADLAGFADLYAQRRIIAVREAIERRAETVKPQDQLLLLQGKDGAKLAGNIDAFPTQAPRDGAMATFRLAPDGGRAVRYLGAGALLPGGFPVLVARATTDRDALLARLFYGALGAGALILVAGLGAGYVLTRRILGRIDAVNAVCARVESGDLSARAAVEADDEFGALSAHVNAMLERITRLNAAAHDLSDAIAHEMRTPLNRVLLRIDRLRRENPGQEETLAPVAAEMRETVAVFEALLDIAAAEAAAGDAAGFSPVDLSAIATEVAELYEAVAEEKGVALRCDAPGAALVLGDRQLLIRMVANLADNAVKFTPSGGTVTLSVAPGARAHAVNVEDDGPGVPAGLETRIFERFVRAGATGDTRGHGLGLSLVKAIAVRHGAKIELKNVSPGLRVRVTCPALPSEKNV
ncbi:MAG TPA: HAMP domain-containing sensor histidine kinase [Rhizobiaceae bacterium]|nr:HAMP domain-containing sensor histidine kinase [Rhizobiaceae bacterium]